MNGLFGLAHKNCQRLLHSTRLFNGLTVRYMQTNILKTVDCSQNFLFNAFFIFIANGQKQTRKIKRQTSCGMYILWQAFEKKKPTLPLRRRIHCISIGIDTIKFGWWQTNGEPFIRSRRFIFSHSHFQMSLTFEVVCSYFNFGI